MTAAAPAAPAAPAPSPASPNAALVAKKAAAAAASAAKQEANARGTPVGFVVILVQILVFVALTWRFRQAFFPLASVVAVGFVVHYWTPLRFKEACWFAITIVGGAYLTSRDGSLTMAVASVGLVLGVAVVIYAIVASPLPYLARLALVAGLFAGIMLLGGGKQPIWRAPTGFYFVMAGIFILRIVPYLYEAKYFKERASFLEYVRYFFMLPGFKLATPVADFQKLKQVIYPRPAREIAQQGIIWIARGAIQFAVFVWLEPHLYYVDSASAHRSPRLVAVHLVCAYAQYLRTSSRIHMYLGIVHLFGYDLPACFRWFGLAHGPLDFWRRTNIYWKDAMTKIVYFPVYFALRKKHDAGAKLFALVMVFVVSWALHVWQEAWVLGVKTPIWTLAATWWQEAACWTAFMVLCLGNLILEIRDEAKPKKPVQRLPPRAAAPAPGLAGLAARARAYVIEQLGVPRDMHPLRAAAQIFAMQLAVAVVFSLRHASSIRVWLNTLAWWH